MYLTYEVNTPPLKRQHRQRGDQGHSHSRIPTGIPLTSITTPGMLVGVGKHRGPEVSGPQGFLSREAARKVSTTKAVMCCF